MMRLAKQSSGREKRREEREKSRSVRTQRSISGEEIKETIAKELAKQKKVPVREFPVSVAGVMSKVGNLGLPIPTASHNDHEYDWPINISQVDADRLRDLMSYYAGHSNYAAVNIAKMKFIVKNLDLKIKRRTSSIRAKYSAQRMKIAEIAGKLEEDEVLEKYENTKVHAEGVLEMILAAKEGYDRNIQVASRELSARESEMRNLGKHFS